MDDGLGQKIGKISYRKLNNSIWVASILGDTAKDALLKAENSFGLVDNPFTFTSSFFGNLKLPILTFSNLKDTFRKLQKNVLMHHPSIKKSVPYSNSNA